MVRVALVTGALSTEVPDAGESLAAFAARADAPLVDALRMRGAAVERPSWRDERLDLSRFDVAVVRTTWDYRDDRDAFVAWAARAERDVALWNPADVVRWNTHKSYLMELEERGAPVVPTAWLGRGDAVDLRALLEARGWGAAVVKPAVGSGGVGVRTVDAGRAGDAQAHLDALLAHGDALVQPRLASAAQRGERSVVVVDGQATHVVRTAPVVDGQATSRRASSSVRERLDRETAQLARWAVDALGTELLHARVDLLDDELGAPQIVEVEATEPHLYLELDDAAPHRLAEAILARC